MNESLEIKKAENLAWLTAAFEQQKLPAGKEFLADYRRQQFAQWSRRGLPSRREEAWKYNDLSFLEKMNFNWPRPETEVALSPELQVLIEQRARDNHLLVFVNGQFSQKLSSFTDLPSGVILGSLRWALETHASLINPYLLKEIDAQAHPFDSLNAALFSDGLFVYVPPETVLKKPLHVLSLALDHQGFMTHPRHLVILENYAQLSFVEEYRSENADLYWMNVSLDFYVGRHAALQYYKLQNEAPGARHLSNIFFHQKQNSVVNACCFSVGGQLTRNDVTAFLREAYASCRTNGFYGLDANAQVIDNHVHIEHMAPHTESVMDYRGVLAGQSRGVFNGKVRVRPEAKKTQARQLNHNLLLSPLAEVDAKPELEIYADEVQCRHGATTGQLDEESLFYLRTRGIDQHSAKIILLQAFVEAVLSEVTLPWVSAAMHELWGRHLETL